MSSATPDVRGELVDGHNSGLLLLQQLLQIFFQVVSGYAVFR
jgi:hypothetical protein